VCDGTADNEQFQAALNALPAGGGKLSVSAGTYDFANLTTVTRAIANVTIEGVGQSIYFTCDGVTPIFTAGGNNWTFSNFKTDAGSISLSTFSATAQEINLQLGATYVSFLSDTAIDSPTGRSATYVVAASDAPAHVKSQADAVCTGSFDELIINSYLRLATGGVVELTEGDFSIVGGIIVPSGTTLRGQGWNVTRITRALTAGAAVSSATLASNIDAAVTDIPVSDGTKFIAGQTIRIGTEDMYISSIVGNTLTVASRGYNATTAALHNAGTAISFPMEVIRNALSLESGSSNVVVKDLFVDAGYTNASTTANNNDVSNGISIRKCNNSVVENCYVTGCFGYRHRQATDDVLRGAGITIDQSESCVVRNNYTTDCSHQGIRVMMNAHKSQVIGNYIWNIGYEGIVSGDKSGPAYASSGEGCNDVVMDSNQVWDCGMNPLDNVSVGITVSIQVTSGVGSYCLRNTISNNHVLRLTAAADMRGIGAGCVVNPSFTDIGLKVDGNTIYGMGDTSMTFSLSPGIVNSNNTIVSPTGTAISYSYCKGAITRGNKITGASGTGIQYGNSSDNGQIISNSITAYTGVLGIYVSSGVSSIIQGNTIESAGGCKGIVVGSNFFLVTNNHITHIGGTTSLSPIETSGSYGKINDNIIVNNNPSGSYNGAGINLYGDYTHVCGNSIVSTVPASGYYRGIHIRSGADNNVIKNNDLNNAIRGTLYIDDLGIGTSISGNNKYIAPGEIRTYSGSLVPTGTCTATTVTGTFTESPLSLKPGANTMTCTASGTINVVMPAGSTAVVTSGDSTVTDSPKTCAAGATTLVTVATGGGADTFTITVHCNAFAWHNPEAQDVLIKKVVLNRTAAGGTATAEINVGIADNGTVDDPGAEFFENLLANNAAALHDSYVAAGTSYGTQTIWVNCQDSASATGGWVVGKIDTEIANSLAGTYYIEVVGK
jgi:hypothetical protein